jgi:hypothetical protein
MFSAGSGQQEGDGDVAICVSSITASHPYFTSFIVKEVAVVITGLVR